MAWTAEKIKQLKKLWLKGKSTIEIGKELGISKNAVVGKVHRLELAARPSPIKRSQKQTPAKPRVTKKEIKPKNVTLMDLKLTSCRWPIGDPKDEDFHFCGADTVTGKPYCAEHCKIAYTSLKELTLQNAKAKKEKEEQELLEKQADAILEADEEVKKAKSTPKKKLSLQEQQSLWEQQADALLAAADEKASSRKSSSRKKETA
jgi:GcrA cell cycle regulator